MKSAGRPILAAFRGRGYAAQAAAAAKPSSASLPAQEAKVSRLPSGVTVASIENYSPVSRVAVFYNAGSRCESGNNLGVTHVLRNAVNLSTENQTNFGVVRNIQQIGGSLSCSTSREHMIYSVDCLRNGLDTGIDFLREVATSPAFKPWEVAGLGERLGLDLAQLAAQPQVRLMEALHQAAFRTTLGRSLYIQPNRVPTINGATLTQFVQDYYTAGNMAIVGVGVDHDQLVFAAKKFHAGQSGAQVAPAQYYGGELRVDEPGPLSSVALVTQGAGLSSADVAAVGVLQQVMGTGPFVKYGSNLSSSKVARAAGAGTNAPFAAACINASYSDAGLFGFQVVAQAADMGSVLKSLVSTFSEATKGSITEADVTRAKNQLRAAAAMSGESSADLLESIGVQALVTGSVMSAAEADAAVTKVSLADVQSVAKKVINAGKPSMAAVGNLSNTPFLDELL